MLSNPLQRFSTYNTLPSSSMLSSGHVPSNHMHGSLDTLVHGSQYSFQQLDQHLDVHQNSHVHRSHHAKHRQHPYSGAGTAGGNGRPSTNGPATSGPIRRRISRACDQCNQLRTKCDGQSPCAHCVEFGLSCEYIRERKKRGKASRKDLAQQAAAAANGHKSPTSRSSEERSPTESRNDNASSTTSHTNDNPDFQRPQGSRSLSLSAVGLDGKNSAIDSLNGRLRADSLESITEISNGHQPHMTNRTEADQIGSPASLNLNGYSSMHGYRPALNPHMMNGNSHPNYNAGQSSLPGYTDLLEDEHLLESESPSRLRSDTPGNYRLAGSMGGSPCPVCGCPGHEGLELA